MDIIHIDDRRTRTDYLNDWPKHIPIPSDDDLEFLAESSNRNTGSDFFETKKRSDSDGEDI